MTRHRWTVRKSAQGFTLLELLVVTAILGAMLGILLPAVQKVRESASSVHCQNNLRQIGLAFQHHHDQLDYFPSGGWEWWTPPTYINGQPTTGADQQAGWGFQILPYLEGDNAWRSGAILAIASANPVFFCPSRRSAETATYPDEYTPPLTGGDLTHGLCDYAASNWEGTGVVRQYYPLRAASVTDGLSNTLLVADKRLDLRELGNNQPDDNEGYTAGWDEDTVRRTDAAPLADQAAGGTGEKRFGSSHPNKFNAVFVDGSVHAIAYTIDPILFAYLGNVADGQAVSGSDF